MKLPVHTTSVFTEVKFKKGKVTCPVCGKTHNYHCSLTEDEGLALCKYVPSDKQAKDGRYEHILKSGSQNALPLSSDTKSADLEIAEKADVDRLNEVYSGFLKCLKLSEAHSNQLLESRGLSDNTIARNLYGSVPDRKINQEVGKKLSKHFDLEGVPGFYKQNDEWCLNISYSGFYIPYRDIQGRIVGLQIRKDIDEKPKYLWLSSSEKEKGCSSGSPLHFVNPDFARKNKIVLITEGALKADIINEKYEAGIVAMAGVTAVNHQKLVDSIFEVFPDLEKVVIAFDMDWKENEAVKKALLSLLNVLKKEYINVFIADWDISLGKGFDDFVNSPEFLDSNDELIDYIPAQDFLKRFFSEEVESYDTVQHLPVEEQTELVENQNFVVVDKEPVVSSPQEQYMSEKTTLGKTWGELSEGKIEKPERVIAGLCRGNVGQLVAATNIGKTTLILNLAISASADKVFEPLFNEHTVGKRIMYIDGEATKGELQADLFKMLESCSLEEQKRVKDNLYLICDEEINDEPLDLVNLEHQERILEVALLFKPDLIVIDTLSALANMEDENDNAKVKKEVIQPLKTLAKKTNSAVLMLHHTGKYTEGSPQAADAYKGRGASALGALCRTVFNLKESYGKVILSCSKVKGEKFPPTVMKLDQNLRWFNVIGDSANVSSKPLSNYEQVIKFVRDAGEPVKRKEINEAFTKNISESQVGKILLKAVTDSDLSHKYGYYSAPENTNPERELPLD